MAVPKRKTSKARRDARRANWKLSIPGIVECPQCHEPKLAHRVCKKCGYYDGKQAFHPKMGEKPFLPVKKGRICNLFHAVIESNILKLKE